jgi:nucleoside-diphosphate kinase
MEKTLVIIKPDAITRRLIGEILGRFEKKGLVICAIKMVQLDEAILKDHYSHLADKPFFKRIKEYMMSAPVVLIALKGINCISIVREICGETDGKKAKIGTIRGDLSMSIQCNLVHASDSPESAKKELERFFNDNEIIEYGSFWYPYTYSAEELS